jgi:hypothetical protein
MHAATASIIKPTVIIFLQHHFILFLKFQKIYFHFFNFQKKLKICKGIIIQRNFFVQKKGN